jgi:serine O-acetyltransferase
MWRELKADVDRHLALMEPSMSSLARAASLLETQGVWASAVYRFGRWARRRSLPVRAAYRVAAKLCEIATGIHLPASAEVGPGLYIGHFGGIVVHPETRMGARCSLSQGVTLGVLGGGRRGAPTLGDGVYLGAGAKVLGPVTIGDEAKVGANAVVVRDVPPRATAVGVPAVSRP